MSFEIIRGDTVSLNMTFTDDDNAPIDLTGYTIFFTVKKDMNDTDAQAVIAVNTTTGDATGKVTIDLTSDDTDVTEGAYHYDLQLVKGSIVESTKSDILSVVRDVKNGVS